MVLDTALIHLEMVALMVVPCRPNIPSSPTLIGSLSPYSEKASRVGFAIALATSPSSVPGPWRTLLVNSHWDDGGGMVPVANRHRDG